MPPRERLIAPFGFVLAGVLFFVAALIPLVKDRPINVVFLPLGVVFLVLGLVTWRRVRSLQ